MTINIITYKKNLDRIKIQEYIAFIYTDNAGNFRFQSIVTKKDLAESFKIHHLCTINSFYKKSRRIDCLKTIYALLIDIDGWSGSIPLSHIYILEAWQEMGFDKTPSQIIRTSEGRFHVLIVIEPIPAYQQYISYYIHVAKGICKILLENGLTVDLKASTDPAVLVRIPGSINYKYPYKPRVESVHESDAVYTLSELNDILIENGIVKPKQSGKSETERIEILETGVAEGNRDNACFTLSLIYKTQGLYRQQAESKLLGWAERCNPPFPPKSVIEKVKSAYGNNYKNYRYWLHKLTQETNNVEFTPTKKRKEPKRRKLSEHISKLESYLFDNDGAVRSSQSKLSTKLDIPIRSLKKILNESHNIITKPIGRGRSAYTVFELREFKDA